jgi:hypothetical protein
MDSGFAFFDIVFFAMVAAFLILRLRSVLGRRTGNENPERWTARKPITSPGCRTVRARPGRRRRSICRPIHPSRPASRKSRLPIRPLMRAASSKARVARSR